MRLMHLTLCTSLALFGLAPAAAQQHPASSEAAYPDTPEGLQKQLEDILQAYKAGDMLKAEKLIKNFCLSDIETAWARAFGTEPRESLAKSYTLECANFESSLGSRLLLLAKTENAEILVRPLATPTSQSQTGKPQANASVKLYLWELRGGDQSPFISLAFFANLHGAFHFFGEAPLPPPPTGPPQRIRVGGQVMRAKLIKQVAPQYPRLAQEEKAQGIVQVQILVGKDGSVLEATIVRGHPLLVQPALEAVRQWRYQPTLINGQPVEVLTTIDVIYTLSR